MKLEFSRQIFKKAQISNLIKIRPVGAELFHAGGRTDRRTDMTKLTIAFRNFANTIQNNKRGIKTQNDKITPTTNKNNQAHRI